MGTVNFKSYLGDKLITTMDVGQHIKKTLATLILMPISYCGFSQADCILIFKYNVKVTSSGIKLDKIYLPSTTFLGGYEKFDSPNGFYVHTLESESFSDEFRSHLSSDFCMDPESIVERIFKKVKKYPIRITEKIKDHVEKFRTYEFEVSIDQIQFVINEGNRIEIIFPEITL